jgi:hypothetical protein
LKSYKDSNYNILLENVHASLLIYFLYESLKERFNESNLSTKNKPKSNVQDNQADIIWNVTTFLYDFIYKMIEKLIIDQKINDLDVKTKLFTCNINKIIINNELSEKLEHSKLFPNFPLKVSDICLDTPSNDIMKFIESQIDIKIKELSKKFIALR